jgi:thiamine-phosphate pyrophosphorylase
VIDAAARLLVLTDRALSAAAGNSLVEVVGLAARAGVRRFVFREKDLPLAERRELAVRCLRVAESWWADLVVASDVALARELGRLPVHCAAADPVPMGGVVWGRSCHSAGDVAAAARDGASYVTVSPLFESESKPGYGPALGVAGLARVVSSAGSVPVFALGGVDAGNAALCVEAGASGVAVMSYVMAAERPEERVALLLESLSAAAA